MEKPRSVVQVGQKERKNPAPFGADFGAAEDEPVIYSARPGLRLWVSNNKGAVSQTLIFKDSVSKPQAKLILLSCQEEYLNNDSGNFIAMLIVNTEFHDECVIFQPSDQCSPCTRALS